MRAFPFYGPWILSLLFIGVPAGTFGQENHGAIVLGEQITIHSEILNEDRRILLGKPASYDQSDEHYPILILLDAPGHFYYTVGLVRFLASHDYMPEVLVVGIENTDRTRDLTPPAQEPADIAQFPSQGGADNFRSFLSNELIPWLAEKYRTRQYRILIGHSFGGLFALDSLVSEPDLFNAYIVISPAMQWDGQRLLERAETFFGQTMSSSGNRMQLNASLYMTAGNEGRELLGGTRKFAGILDEKAPIGFQWRFEHLPTETHGSVPLRSTYQGLEYIFSDWAIRNLVQVYDTYGIEAIERFYENSDAKYGYTRGVPIPTITSLVSALGPAGRAEETADLILRYSDIVQPPPAFLERIGAGLRERGQTERAINIYRLALQGNPDNATARQALAELGHDLSDVTP